MGTGKIAWRLLLAFLCVAFATCLVMQTWRNDGDDVRRGAARPFTREEMEQMANGEPLPEGLSRENRRTSTRP
jgi:hypothetical protein